MQVAEDVDELRAQLTGPLHRPGTPGYARATSPRNATVRQRPTAVVAVSGPADVACCLRWVAARGASGDAGTRVAVQATGHGASHDIGTDTLLLDTSGLDRVQVDPQRRVARVGAGATFAAIDAAAWRHGLLAPGGTAPDVAVVGYTGWGGIGWLTRPHGPASASLVSVEVVDAAGRVLHADEDTSSELLWAYRGGGGAGIATELQLRLYPAADLAAGYLLWPADRAGDVVAGWARALDDLHPALSTTIGVLHRAPDAPTVPAQLRGQAVVHLAAASVVGEDALGSLRAALRDLPRPAIDTLGPCDASRLSTIHLDPPGPVPAVGEGRWLTAAARDRAGDILTAGSALGEVELRHVAHAPTGVAGALTDCPGPLLLHATGAGPDPEARRATREALDAVLAAAGPADTGRSATAFRDGQPDSPGALDPAAVERLRAVRLATDPDRLVTGSRVLA